MILITLLEILIEARDEHPLKAPCPIYVMLSCISTEDSAEHKVK